MNNMVKLALLGGALTVLGGGCATQSTSTADAPPPVDQALRNDVQTALQQARQALEEAQNARRLAEQALNAARQAQDDAAACQARCEAVEAQIERAFQQSQSK